MIASALAFDLDGGGSAPSALWARIWKSLETTRGLYSAGGGDPIAANL